MKVAEPTPHVEFTGCCPRFDPTTFSAQELVWKDKLFVAEHVHSIFHVPLNMTHKAKHATALIRAAGAQPPGRPLFLGEEISAFRSNIYIEVTHHVPQAEMVALSGTFVPKLFEGPFQDAQKWCEEMRSVLRERGQKIQRLLYGYTTCPACSKAYGENFVVLYAQIAGGDAQHPS